LSAEKTKQRTNLWQSNNSTVWKGKSLPIGSHAQLMSAASIGEALQAQIANNPLWESSRVRSIDLLNFV